MFSVNISKLRGEVEAREQKKNKIFEAILDLCYKKILSSNEKSDDYSCTYIVPNVVFGLPLYDVDECVRFIMRTLTSKGFEIFYAMPTTLHISWKPEDKKYNTNYDINSNYNNIPHYQILDKINEPSRKHKKQNKDTNLLSIMNKNINYNSGNVGNVGNDSNYHNQMIAPDINNTLTQMTKEQQKQKIYRPIDDYIDSRPLIYDPDDIQVFQTKLNHIFD